ncbi:MAG: resolvase [Candidatus Saganbacteria bacterium]|nr:resolvase [Candidatus Saganbacteria bacterium]
MILAIDPGREKCGIAVLDNDGRVICKQVVLRSHAIASVISLMAKYSTSALVVGRSASGKEIEKNLLRLDLRTNIIFVSEEQSTLLARKRYWKENKPQGLLKLIPTSMRFPPIPVDDYAAVILGERYLKG